MDPDQDMQPDSSKQREVLSSKQSGRTADQRRRIMISAAMVAPAIIASSAQTAYASNGGTKVSDPQTVAQRGNP